jgi:hypothetical protein
MAIEEYAVSTRMQLRLNTGLDGDGKEILRTKTYSNVKSSSENQAVYDVASSLAGLQEHELKEVHRVDDVVLVNV